MSRNTCPSCNRPTSSAGGLCDPCRLGVPVGTEGLQVEYPPVPKPPLRDRFRGAIRSPAAIGIYCSIIALACFILANRNASLRTTYLAVMGCAFGISIVLHYARRTASRSAGGQVDPLAFILVVVFGFAFLVPAMAWGYWSPGRRRGFASVSCSDMKALTLVRQTSAGEPLAPNISFVSDWPEPPAPPPGHAIVRTLAGALNHLDLWVARGVPGLNLTYPRISGSDACGLIEQVGPGVDASWIGRKVILNAALDVAPLPTPDEGPRSSLAPMYELIGEHRSGTLCEKFTAPITNLQPIRDDQDPVEAAAFGLTFLTSYSMIRTKANLRPGQSVLLTGIGGGVACASLAIARHLGCRVCVTSRHQWKLDRAKSLGADHAILDSGQDWSKEVRAWTKSRGSDGVSLAVDSSGKATHIKCIKSLTRGGAYVTPGCTSGADATTDLARIFWNQLRLLGSTMGTNEEFAEVTALYRSNALKPVIDNVFEAPNGAAAYARLESADQFGKVVVRFQS